jgi:hypothetical protein
MKSHCSIAASSAFFVLLSTTRCFGQASEAEMQSFPMPPPSGYAAQKIFAYIGDYGYYTEPLSSVPGRTANASDYRYVRYSGIDGKKVYVYGAWGTTPIPPAQGGADACGHAHASYGVWGKYELRFFFGVSFSGWSFLGGGGMSGNRKANGQCVLDTNNPLSSIDPRYGWGETFQWFDFKPTCVGGTCWRYTELVVGALSDTHGWGSCNVPPNTFKACFEPSYIIGFTLY